ncbi:MAG TPA: SDR family NAD-dependent epimerase/dehydratase, partial [Thermoanaerobaculia bacterium]|nr:SDR family NAD-dependent epimerase/dehydratase [Thermoanaerobaculia bacterium]
IEDLTDFYVFLITADPAAIRGEAFNVSKSNATVMELAEMIRDEIDPATPIEVVPTEDNRSYHLSAEKVKRTLGFAAARPLSRAVADLTAAFADGRVPDPDSPRYRNVDVMKARPELAHWSTPAQ